MATLGQAVKLAAFSGSVGAAGNIVAQYLVSRSERSDRDQGFIARYDPVQTARFFVYSASFTQISYRWHAFLNKKFPIGTIASSAKVHKTTTQVATQRFGMALKRVAVDQTVFAPFATGAFVFGMGILEGLDAPGLVERARVQYLGILVAGYALWPAAQLINFAYVPLLYRVPFGSVHDDKDDYKHSDKDDHKHKSRYSTDYNPKYEAKHNDKDDHKYNDKDDYKYQTQYTPSY
ncbi:hypothetical protein LPJ53_006261 [Coemansia erecta]|uniref:Uncharacterized protein n=1 Tax=Coemansia erecta TaxID=147472 RepID=A0A9W7XVJ1_9FUNG|nr:hypothetical protein LPJ53_006261 [Coemansia erecta]